MITREQSIIIATSPEKIWELLAADRIPEWQPYMAKNKRRKYLTEVNTQDDKYKVGATTLFDGDCHFEVLESIENEKMIYHIYEKSILGRLGGRLIFSIEPVESGCKFTYRAEMEFPNLFVEKLVGNYFTLRWFEKQLRTNLEKLKAVLEGSS